MDYAIPHDHNSTLYDVLTPSSHMKMYADNITPSSQMSTSGDTNATITYFDPDSDPGYVIMRRLQTVLIPLICVMGILGNVMAAGTFLSSALNNTSCCFYLAAKSLNDIGFLVSLFVVWLYRLRVPLFTTPGICHITVFLTYVCGCLSVWFVVVVTAENFIRLVKPGLVFKYCKVDKAKRIVVVITIISALIYNTSIWTTGVVQGPDGETHCTSYQHFNGIVMALTFIDTALTLIFPTLIMFILIVTVVIKSMEAFERKQRLRSSSKQTSGGQRKRLTPEGKMTTFLFAISVIFLILNLPTHAIRLKMLIQVYVHQQDPSYSDHILQRIFEILLYFNFSTNCIIYLTCGERFRQVFTAMYLSRFYQKKKITNDNCTEGTSILLSRRLEERDESACLTCLNDVTVSVT